MTDITPHLNFLKEGAPSFKFIDEAKMLLTRLVKNMPDQPVGNIVGMMRNHLEKVEDYVTAHREIFPGSCIDFKLLDIFYSVSINRQKKFIKKDRRFKVIGLRENILLAKRIHSLIPDDSIDENENFDDINLQIIIYILKNETELTYEMLLERASIIRSKLSAYLNIRDILRKLNVERIELILWIRDAYPTMNPESTAKWANIIASSKLYRQYEWHFPASFPFHLIRFDSNTDGTANIQILGKTLFAEDLLAPFRELPNARKINYGITFEFDLAQEDLSLRENMVNVTQMVISALELNFPPKSKTDSDLIRVTKQKLIAVVNAHITDFDNHFSGMKHEQLHPPIDDQQANNHHAVMDLHSRILDRNVSGVHGLLAESAEHANPIRADTLHCVLGNNLKDDNDVNAVISIAALLIEYGAEPCALIDSGQSSFLEYLIDRAARNSLDGVNKKLMEELVKLTLRLEIGRSHLAISNVRNQHPIGSIIIKAKNDLEEITSKEPPQLSQLQDFTLMFEDGDCSKRPTLKVTNYNGQEVYINTYTLDFFALLGNEKRQVLELCQDAFSQCEPAQPSSGDIKDVFNEYFLEKLKPKPNMINLIDLITDKDQKVRGFIIVQIDLPKDDQQPTLHFIPLAVSDKLIRNHFKRLMTIIALRYVVTLSDHREVLTAYTAASAMSYSLTAELQVYPKYNNLKERDWQRIYQTFFKGREFTKPSNGPCLFKSKLSYPATANNPIFKDRSSTNCEAFNNRFYKRGCSSLTTLYSTPNLQKMSRVIQPQLARNFTFFGIARLSEVLVSYALRKNPLKQSL